jgi:autotransporter-associated beta strand protein
MKLPQMSSPIRRRAPFSLAAAVAAILASQSARATILTWDSDPSTFGAQDGVGTWDNQNLNNWWDGLGNAQWSNAAPDSAMFGSASGPADVVSLGSNITVGNLTFSPTGGGTYTIEGAGRTLTLSSTTISGSTGATLNVNLAGTTGLASTNTSTIRLSGANTYSGLTTAVGGTLLLDSVGALGNSTQITIGNSTGGVGSLLVNVPDTSSTTVGAGKTVTIFGSGIANFGALRGADGASNTWAGNVVIGSTGSRISGGNSGTINVTGVISGTNTIIFSRNTNATTVLSSVNAYTGDTQLFNSVAGSTATLRIGVDNAINAGSRLSVLSNLSAGPEVVDLNGHILSFRTLDTSATTTVASASNLMIVNSQATASTLTVGDPTAANTGTFGGSIRNNPGVISLVKGGANLQILVGTNTYTGTTTVNSGTLQISAATPTTGNIHFNGSDGSLASSGFVLNGGTLALDNLGNANNNVARVPDTADFTFGGGAFVFRGSDQVATNSTETIRNLNLSSGLSQISVRQGGTNTAVLNANQLTRSAAGGLALINGTNLGMDGTSTSSVGRLLLATALTLVGTTAPLSTGINAAAQNTQIVPILLGEAAAASGGLGTVTGNPNTFLTYEATTGLRPLNPTDEFTINSIVDGNNTRVTANTTAATAAAINSLVLNGPANTTLSISNTLTNTSGALLFVSGNTITGGTLEFGNVEAIITVNSGQTGIIASRIGGTGGVTLYGPGTLGVGNANSTFSGNTAIRSGTVVPQASSIGAPGVVTSGPFGTGTLILAGGGTRGTSTSAVTIANDILFQADTTIAAGGMAYTLSGPVTLAGGTRRITNSSATSTTFSGVIGDGGQNFGLTIAGGGAGPLVLSGANTYVGPTTILSSTLIVSGSLSGTSTTTVGNIASLATAATLGGSGTLGNVSSTGSSNPATSGATIDPGNSANVAGILNTNAFSLTNGAHLSLQIGGTTAGGETATGYDQLAASGAVTLTGGDLKLALLGTPTFNLGDRLFLVVNNSGSSVTGTFATVNGAAFDPSNIVIGTQQFQLAYNANFSGAGSDSVANDVALVAVPEPHSCIMLAGALGLLANSRRRRG